jgi:hypothetical protein
MNDLFLKALIFVLCMLLLILPTIFEKKALKRRQH